MKIFQLCADSGIAVDGNKGASIHLRSLAAGFARLHDVVVITKRPVGSDAMFPFPVERYDGPDSLDGTVDRHGVPDVVYERYSLGHVAGLEFARSIGRPFVLEVNAPLVDEARRHRPGSVSAPDVDAEMRLFRDADLVVVVSEALRARVGQVRGAGPIIVEHNGFDPSLFSGDVEPDPRPTLGFLGHPKPWHGAEVLPSVLEELRRRGHDARLLIVGGGPGADAVAAAARACGIEEHLEITGALDQADAITRIRGAWIGMAPYPDSDFFYFSPIKVMEYLAAGLPVVATAVGEVPALVGEAGVIVPPGQAGAIVEAVDALLGDAGARRELGRIGRARMDRDHTWDAVARRTVDAVAALRTESSR
ncbi:MAG: glycosyltransferase family 4 protein [Ilumatobacteraceae bacterium]